MERSSFTTHDRGAVVRTTQGYDAFIPSPLPRVLLYSAAVVEHLDLATAALHRLAGVGRLLPNPRLLIAPHVRLEAVLSSRIEGTQSDVDDLVRFEASRETRHGEVHDDVRKVENYLVALRHGLSRINDLPLGIRLIKEVHEKLMDGVRGNHATPGEFRRTQNWIGGTTPNNATFVPPPVDEMKTSLADLERFLQERPYPLLLQLAIAHYQFEAIHPFLDGNGRVGRLLVPLVLAEREVLPQPLLYLSAYFERHRTNYYDHLLVVSQTGNLDDWLQFFLEGVRSQSRDAEERTVRLVELQAVVRSELHGSRASVTALRLGELLFSSPYVTAQYVREQLDVTKPTAHAAIETLMQRGWLEEVSGRSRGRLYFCRRIFDAVYAETVESSSLEDAQTQPENA